MAVGTVTYTRLGQNGRLANQLFQIAATIAYGLDHGKEFSFPPWEYSKWFEKQIPEGTICVNDNYYNQYCEPHFHYAGIPNLPGNVNLFGHFQSEKYFMKYEKTMREYFSLKKKHEDYIWAKYSSLFGDNTCSIHVRRTDYDTPVNRDFHGVMPMEYYRQAIERLYCNEIENIQFIICSDDPQWCKENFKLPQMIFSEGEENVIDLFLMSFCRNNIIANSSFSWWSAWLNCDERKRVVSPKKWFNNAPHDSKDVHCESWIVI